MASYKVPQDVEAEDKLLGPFSFRQFIYLIVAAIAGLLAWGLSRIFIGLIVLPMPIIAFFLILALPLKKDQPMETYLSAVVRFWLKPRKRIWDPEGNVINVEITAPRTVEQQLTKDFTGDEASQRLSYLAQIVDTGGWASRGLASATANVNLSDTLVAEAQTAEDILDDTANVSQNLETMITKTDTANRQAMIDSMRSAMQAPPPISQTSVSQAADNPTTSSEPAQSTAQAANDDPTAPQTDSVDFNPYPASIHQKVINPHAAQATKPTTKAQASSTETVSPDIMRLATSKDLSISTIAREAQRLKDKEEGEEVVISLR